MSGLYRVSQRAAKSCAPLVAALLAAFAVVGGQTVLAESPGQSSDQELKAGLDRARSCVLKVECLDRNGTRATAVFSAVAIDDHGHLLTVGLRSPGDRQLCVSDCAGKKHEALWIGVDDQTGLTLLKVDPGLVSAPQVSKELPELGTPVIVVGNPFGLSHSVTVGNVSGLDRTVSLSGGVGRGLIQFTAPVFPGDSGGLLADRRGRMLGIVSTVLGDPGAENLADRRLPGIGFAIPVSELRGVVDQLRQGKRIERGYLGVTAENIETGGVQVTAVAEGSPAQAAGLQTGDVIEALNDEPVKNFDELASRVEHLRPGTQAKLSIRRDGKNLSIQATLGERKPSGTSVRRPFMPPWTDGFGRFGPESAWRDFWAGDIWNRVESLEERVRKLEKRLEELEKRQGHSDTAPARRGNEQQQPKP